MIPRRDRAGFARAARGRARWAAACAVGAACLVAGCQREERAFRVVPAAAARNGDLRLTELQAGPPSPTSHRRNELEGNAVALAEGKRLFTAFNCVGCHGYGGGGMGPALLDDKWRYGSAPAQIVATILEGRPNGMPSFRGKLSEHQAWQIAGYVRSLSGLVPMDAAPSRDDHMKSSPPPSSRDPVERALAEPARPPQ